MAYVFNENDANKNKKMPISDDFGLQKKNAYFRRFGVKNDPRSPVIQKSYFWTKKCHLYHSTGRYCFSTQMARDFRNQLPAVSPKPGCPFSPRRRRSTVSPFSRQEIDAKKALLLASFLVSISRETFVRENRWFRVGGYRRICRSCLRNSTVPCHRTYRH